MGIEEMKDQAENLASKVSDDVDGDGSHLDDAAEKLKETGEGALEKVKDLFGGNKSEA